MKNIIKILFTGVIISVAVSINIFANDAESIYLWKFSSGPMHSKPVIRDSIAYFGTTDSLFYAINLNDGTEIWHYKADRNNSFPALKDTIVVFEASNKIYALNAFTGQYYWSFTNNPVGDDRVNNTDYHRSSPVINDTLVIFCDQEGIINGIDLITGKLIYQFQTDGHYPLRATPAVKDSLVFAGDFKGNIYAVSLKDSVLIWKHAMQNVREYYGAVVSEMVIKDNILYFGSQHDVFSPLDIATGEPVWTYVDTRATYLPPTPVFFEDNIIIGTTIYANQIMCFKNDVNHEPVWNFQATDIFFTTPVIKDSILFINSCNFNETDGHLYLLNCKNGKLIRQMEFTNTGPYTPVIKDSVLYIGTNNGLYAANINAILAGKGSNISLSSEVQMITYESNKGKKSIKVEVSNTGNVCDSVTIELSVAEQLDKVGFTINPKRMLSKLSQSPTLNVYTDSLPAGVYHLTLTFNSQLQPEMSISKSLEVSITQPTDLVNFNSQNDVFIYPNPASNLINFKFNESLGSNVNLIIYSISGSIVWNKSYNDLKNNNYELTWNLRSNDGNRIPKGEYICQIKIDKGLICKKIVVI